MNHYWRRISLIRLQKVVLLYRVLQQEQVQQQHLQHHHKQQRRQGSFVKILMSDPETAPIFPNPPLVSFKRARNLRNSLVRSSLPSNLEPGTFNCSRKICRTCPFINSKRHIQGPKGSYQVNDHLDCITSNIIYCITCTLCNKLYIGKSGRI